MAGIGGFYRYLIGEPFCYQMGPYQTLWAETWCTLLQMTFHVFFMSRNQGKITKTGPQIQGRVIPGKKRPLPGMPETVDRTGHPKMMPQPFSTQWDYPNPFFYSFLIKFVGNRPKTY